MTEFFSKEAFLQYINEQANRAYRSGYLAGVNNRLSTPASFDVSNYEYEGKVSISWQVVENASGYLIERSDGFNINIDDGGTTYFEDTGIGNIPYSYTIKALAGGGKTNSLRSMANFGSGFTYVGVPQNFQASDSGFVNVINITWDRVSESFGYEIYKDDLLLKTITDNSVTSWNYLIQTNDVFSFKIKALGNNAAWRDSSFSVSDAGNSYVIIETPIINVTQAVYENAVDISWDAIENATTYQILLSDGTLIDETSSLHYRHECGDNVNRYYQVRAVGNGLEWGDSLLSKAKLGYGYSILETPEVTVSKGDYIGKLFVNWTDITGATAYNIWVNGIFKGAITGISYDYITAIINDFTVEVQAISSSNMWRESEKNSDIGYALQYFKKMAGIKYSTHKENGIGDLRGDYHIYDPHGAAGAYEGKCYDTEDTTYFSNYAEPAVGANFYFSVIGDYRSRWGIRRTGEDRYISRQFFGTSDWIEFW